MSPKPLVNLKPRSWISDRMDIDADGCWRWNRYINPRGYGIVHLSERSVMAHVLSYTISKGPVPEGLELDHLCRNKSCVNPDHLEAVTHKENVRRAPLMGRGKSSIVCPKCNAYMLQANQMLETKYRDGSQYARCRSCRKKYDDTRRNLGGATP